MTDYSAVPVADIVEQLSAWHTTLGEDRTRIQNISWRLAKVGESPAVREGVRYAKRAVELFDRFRTEFDRLQHELPSGVTQGHPEAMRQLYRSARELDEASVRFKQAWHLDMWTDDPQEMAIMAELYEVVRTASVDLFDTSNIAHRLDALVRPVAGTTGAAEIMELRPNFYGLGINLRAVWPWIRERWKRFRG